MAEEINQRYKKDEEEKMSYQRSPYPLLFSKGVSDMYVYGDGKEIIHYGYSHADMIEMLIEQWETKDIQFKHWFVTTLARALDVKLRNKPLEWGSKQWEKEMKAITKKHELGIIKIGINKWWK